MTQYNKNCRPVNYGLSHVDNTADIDKPVSNPQLLYIHDPEIRYSTYIGGVLGAIVKSPDTDIDISSGTTVPYMIVLEPDTIATTVTLPNPSVLKDGTVINICRAGNTSTTTCTIVSGANSVYWNGQLLSSIPQASNRWYTMMTVVGGHWYATSAA